MLKHSSALHQGQGLPSSAHSSISAYKRVDELHFIVENTTFDQYQIIIFDDDFEFFGITHNEPNLTIRGGIVFEAFDFNGDGTDEDADIDFEFIRS